MSTSTSLADTVSTLGPIRQTYARKEDFPPVARAYTRLAEVIREAGLLRRSTGFYLLTGAAIAVGFGGAITGSILLGESWFQLLMAAAFGILFTQVAFFAHEAGHRQILSSGLTNDRLARVLAAFVGLSYSWWDSKHSRHHANPNRVGKDPDIEVDTISFLDEDAVQARGLRRLITRKQGWFFFPLLTLEGLNLHMHSFRHLFSRGPVKARWAELGMIVARFALVLTPMFPSMARPQLAQTREIVREYCATHGVPYAETSLWRSYAIVIDYLNTVGLTARDPFDCPMVSEYRRA
ncbi:fatty acid desaturase family protein [Microbacterium gorillae]|uniref:fatty acid desaturase family protein n=1 Tax=Microbacterium gorillae TaxID=1231063 RepID=UPI0005901A52|nr:acyl-CoA desaturase [Microbacterium gorillae]